jgi:hypothetical protein
MSRKFVAPKNIKNERIRRERAPVPWRYFLTIFVCGLFLAAGFFGAARQHFASIDYGIKNSKLRKQIEELEAEKRRLLLTKEIALSPAEIKKSAKQIGMVEMSASNIEVLTPRAPKAAKDKTAKPLLEKTVDAKPLKGTLDVKSAKPDLEALAAFKKDGKRPKTRENRSEKRVSELKPAKK